MSIHPHLAYQLARGRQEELRHQANLRSNQWRDRPQKQLSRRLLRRVSSWPLESKSRRSVPAR